MKRVVVFGIIAACAAVAQETAEELVELKIQVPKPMFTGTPRNIVSANLEEPGSRERKPIKVPKGTANVALEKPVTSSDEEPIIGELELVTDGDKDADEGYFVELGFDRQWVQIDLETPHAIYVIAVWHFHSQARVYRDMVVQVADDADFIKNVRTVFNNDHDNSAGLGVGKDKEYIETFEGRIVETKGLKTRYVRLYSKGNTSNDMNHYIEVEVFGKPAE